MRSWFTFIWLSISPLAYATQDLYVPLEKLSLDARYEIPEKLSEKGRSIKGTLKLKARISRVNGGLKHFQFILNGRAIDLDIAKRLKQHVNVQLHDIRLLQASGYIDSNLRDEIVGIGAPYIGFTGLRFEDLDCDSKTRELLVFYDLESEQVEIEDYCWEP